MHTESSSALDKMNPGQPRRMNGDYYEILGQILGHPHSSLLITAYILWMPRNFDWLLLQYLGVFFLFSFKPRFELNAKTDCLLKPNSTAFGTNRQLLISRK